MCVDADIHIARFVVLFILYKLMSDTRVDGCLCSYMPFTNTSNAKLFIILGIIVLGLR